MRSIILITAVVIVQSLACSTPKSTDNRKGQNSETLKPSQPRKTMVLLRRAEISEIALDGALFMDGIYRATRTGISPLKDATILSSTDSLDITEERSTQVLSPKEKAAPTSDTWKEDPKAFDFVVYCEMNSKEQTKHSLNEKLTITVKETWRVELVTDPKVVKTWDCNYILTAGGSFTTTSIAVPINDKEIDQIAEQQTEKMIAPVRGPILKEIREFIKANSASIVERR